MSKLNETISATINVKLKPWTAPNYALRANKSNSDGGIYLQELSDDVLEEMVYAWIVDVYTKAGRIHVPFYRPAKQAPENGRG